ncbi:hypothetical protein TNCV_3616101 [Trichonephila clavipes]|nr:hypothetical protein TNCV_3616101 [Trichonephila clavipes]
MRNPRNEKLNPLFSDNGEFQSNFRLIGDRPRNFEPWSSDENCDIFDGEWRQQTGSHNGLKEFGAPLTTGEAYLKIIMSSFLGFCEWNTRNRWRNGQVCPDVDKELWRLGLLLERRKEEMTRKERSRKKGQESPGERTDGEREENPRVLLGDADQESETRMSKNALRTGRRQAVE